jgi:uncharacterized membrane protein YbhN (UPF0104 family)
VSETGQDTVTTREERPRTVHEEEMPRVVVTRRQTIAAGVFVLTVVGFMYFVLPKLAGVGSTLHHLESGDVWWIAVGVVLELASFAGYVVLFRAVFVSAREPGVSISESEPGIPASVPEPGVSVPVSQPSVPVSEPGVPVSEPGVPVSEPGVPVPEPGVSIPEPGAIGWRESYQITMAGLAATRLFATAGAGGIALTAWALRRSGMAPRLVACRMVAFMVLLYAVYAGSVLIDGIGLASGLFPGGGSPALTIVPAIIAAALIGLVGAMALLPGDIERRLRRWGASSSGRVANWVAIGATAPALAASGVRTAIELIRSRDPRLLGAVAWWGFDISVLWAMFHAFGAGGVGPSFAVIWMAYFLGMLGNLLPLPGGLGGVEGGMIGAFAAFGVDFNLALASVLAYRAISFWLPTIPGTVAYFQLRRTVARWREEQQGAQGAGRSVAAEPARAGGGIGAAGVQAL